MTVYFGQEESIDYRLPDQTQAVLSVVADRYIGLNPAIPFTFRAFNKGGILQDSDGLYDINLTERFPIAELGEYAYAAAKVWSDADRDIDLGMICYGPVQFFMNEVLLYRSNAVHEVKLEHKTTVGVTFRKGWNKLFLKLRNTTAGFGCRIGAEEAKVRILHVLSPFAGRSGQAGWTFSEPVSRDIWVDSFPDLDGEEAETDLHWLPAVDWAEPERCLPACERLFGVQAGRKALAWTKLQVDQAQIRKLKLTGQSSGALRIWMNQTIVLERKEAEIALNAGMFEAVVPFDLSRGSHHMYVETTSGNTSWDWRLQIWTVDEEESERLQRFDSPWQVHGSAEHWFYLGPFGQETTIDAAELPGIHQVLGGRYWQLDVPNMWIRPYYENALLSNKWTTSGVTNYARWDYPLGVTMYGLLQTGRLLGRQNYIDYALSHIKACTDFYDYSLWDKAEYGFPSVNQQLVLIKMLDNCGSFGSSMLEAMGEGGDDSNFLRIAHMIGDFMLHKLERRDDGAFYRICAGEYSENSMWADDLYMSTPFLVRYSALTGEDAPLDEAVRQFLLYRQYLFMSDEKIMSHVYDFKYSTATRIPWGRGNGWTIFSLSEVLAALPDHHPERSALLTFFNELCEGYLALQGDNGLWHQVLNDPDAYEEASCTAMFIYAFCRGVYKGWLQQPEPYAKAALRGWSGLKRKAIDRHGNVHGVCSGSRYAFTADYYKEELRTVTNDNHGIGIMLLAGVEIEKMLSRA